jgi:hypothetical protein
MTATVGDFPRKSYEILSSGTVKANLSREFIRQQNLTIDVPNDGDVVSLVAVVLAIETLRDDRRQTESAIPFLSLRPQDPALAQRGGRRSPGAQRSPAGSPNRRGSEVVSTARKYRNRPGAEWTQVDAPGR